MFATIYLPNFFLQAAIRHQAELHAKPVALIEEQERKPVVIGWVRLCSDAEADDIWNRGNFASTEFFEVIEGRLPPTIFYAIEELDSGRKDYVFDRTYTVALFIKEDTPGIRNTAGEQKHPNYSLEYPAVNLGRI